VADNAWYYWSGAITDTTAPTVTMSPAAGLYNTSKSVTLTVNETATIYYTTDGSTPTTSSTVYSAPISISATTTLKYFAKDTAGNSSAVQTAVFTIDTVLPVLTITSGGTFTGTKSVTMSTDETADIYYTIDGSTPTTSSMKYTSALSITATTTLKAFAKDTAGNSSSVQTVTYTLDAPADTTAPTVTASPAAGTYTSAQSVTLTANETATIYYTTNGTTPTTASTVYTGPISISATTTLQFIGKDTAGNTSTPVAATYTINIPDTTAPVLTITPAATFTTNQTVTMSTNETATIWYTVDGSDPTTSGTKVQYSSPVTLTATTTVKAYAVDSSNNASAVQTVTYTKQSGFAEGSNALQLNGTSDYLEYNDFQYDTLELTVNLDSAGAGYLFDARSSVGGGVNNAYLLAGSAPPAIFSDIKVNDVSVTKDASTVANFPRGTKAKLTFVFTSALGGTATTVLFGRGATYYTQNFKGNVYSVKTYKAGVLQSHWDFTNQTTDTNITDQTGNNHIMTRKTGTWITG
jgi:hypothetical protein